MFLGHRATTWRLPSMTKPIIALIGHKQAGKDSLATYLCVDHGYTRVAFADELKAIALELDPLVRIDDNTATMHLADLVRLVGWDGAKTEPDVRHFLQNLGVSIRMREPDFWVWAAEAKLDETDGPVVVTDVRFINEVDSLPDAMLVRVLRGDADLAAALDPHVSEHELDGYPTDYIVENNSSLHALRDAAAGLAAAATAHATGLTVS